MLDKITLGSDQIDIMRKQSVMNLARQMYLGNVSMPRTNAEFGLMIQTKVQTKQVAFPFSAFGTRNIVEAQALVHVDSRLCYTDNKVLTETEVHTSYHTLVADAVQQVTKSIEDLITDAISEAHGMFRENFKLPELFIFNADIENGKRLYDFLVSNTDLDEGIVAGIRALPEIMKEDRVVLKVCQTTKKVEVLSSGKEIGLLDLSHYYNLTPILRFVASFRNSNNPTQEEVRSYHEMIKLTKEFC